MLMEDKPLKWYLVAFLFKKKIEISTYWLIIKTSVFEIGNLVKASIPLLI